jgi:putative hydrolase of the HAD superfamily
MVIQNARQLYAEALIDAGGSNGDPEKRGDGMLNMLKAVLFDFGGVIAEEGFWEGIRTIGKEHGLEPDAFFQMIDGLIYETGYLTGKADEAEFWNEARKNTDIKSTDAELRTEILKRFVLRLDMIASVDLLRSTGLIIAMLSDQTNWLEEIDKDTGLFRHFDRVFNSYRTHKSKRDASVFRNVCTELGVKTKETLFIDDNIDHIKRAREQGLHTIHFIGMAEYKQQIEEFRRTGMLSK